MYKILKAKKSDFLFVSNLLTELYGWLSKFSKHTFDAKNEISYEEYINNLNDFYVLKNESKLFGVMASKIRDIITKNKIQKRTFFIYALIVNEKFRNQNGGSALINHVLKIKEKDNIVFITYFKALSGNFLAPKIQIHKMNTKVQSTVTEVQLKNKKTKEEKETQAGKEKGILGEYLSKLRQSNLFKKESPDKNATIDNINSQALDEKNKLKSVYNALNPNVLLEMDRESSFSLFQSAPVLFVPFPSFIRFQKC